MLQTPRRDHRSAWLEIDLDALVHNVGVIASVVGPGVEVVPVVKADAYGHGLATVGPLLDAAADALAVATLDEALVLRQAGATGRVIVLYPVPGAGVADAIEADVELTLMSKHDLDAVAAAQRGTSGRTRVHLAIETGMSRGGLGGRDLESLAPSLARDPTIEVVGVWTHLASADDAAASRDQLERYEQALDQLHRAGLKARARHIAASEGIFAATAPSLDLVRPGLAVYGVLDDPDSVAPALRGAAASLRPAMALKARATAFSDVPVGGGVGYGMTWRAERETRIAVLPVGYGDGYARGTGGARAVLLRGRRLPLVGVISMDAIAVDITDERGVDEGDEFVLLGRQGDSVIAASELARWRNTIAWETLSGMAQRLPRVYNRSAGADPEL